MLLLDGAKIPVLQGTGNLYVQNLWIPASTFPVHSTCQHVEGTCRLCTQLTWQECSRIQSSMLIYARTHPMHHSFPNLPTRGQIFLIHALPHALQTCMCNSNTYFERTWGPIHITYEVWKRVHIFPSLHTLYFVQIVFFGIAISFFRLSPNACA